MEDPECHEYTDLETAQLSQVGINSGMLSNLLSYFECVSANEESAEDFFTDFERMQAISPVLENLFSDGFVNKKLQIFSINFTSRSRIEDILKENRDSISLLHKNINTKFRLKLIKYIDMNLELLEYGCKIMTEVAQLDTISPEIAADLRYCAQMVYLSGKKIYKFRSFLASKK